MIVQVKPIKCPHCGEETEAGWLRCAACGGFRNLWDDKPDGWVGEARFLGKFVLIVLGVLGLVLLACLIAFLAICSRFDGLKI